MFHIQDLKSKHSNIAVHFSLCNIGGGFFVGSLFDPEDGGDMVIRNARFPLNYTILQTKSALFHRYCKENLITNMFVVFIIFLLLILIKDPLVYKVHCVFLGHFQEQTHLGNPEV
jgi:hypothetical protein